MAVWILPLTLLKLPPLVSAGMSGPTDQLPGSVEIAGGGFIGSADAVAAGSCDLVAANIRRIAEEHRVPVFESPKLARALYKTTDLDQEIPAGLYVAVAQVLSYIFRLRTLNPTLAARMTRPDPKIGDEYADV